MHSIRLSISADEHQKMLMRNRTSQELDNEKLTAPFFQNSGETFWHAEHATQYSYDNISEKWVMKPIKIRIAKNEFARGGMRVCYRAGVIQENGTVFPCVVKVFKRSAQTGPDVVFHEALTQSVAQSFAQSFNAVLKKKKIPEHKSLNIKFLPVHVLKLPDRGNQYFATMEPFLEYPDSYVKLNDNVGRKDDSEAAELAQTFSYFTYVVSKHRLVVCDIQGVGNTYTDPQIHSVDGTLFGAGNLGMDGINLFLSSFQYTTLSDRLNLPSPSADFDEVKQIVGELGTIDSLRGVIKLSKPKRRPTLESLTGNLASLQDSAEKLAQSTLDYTLYHLV